VDTGRELDRSQRRSVVDNAIYVDGRRTDDPANLHLFSTCSSRN